MKILLLSQYWYPENGVPQRRWSWLSKLLKAAGHEVTVIAPPPHYQRKMTVREWLQGKKARSSSELEFGPSGEKILRSGFLPASSSLTLRALNQVSVGFGQLWMVLRRSKQLRGFQPDLVIGTVPALPTSLVTPLVARIMRRPYVVDLRDAWPDLLSEKQQWNSGTGRSSFRERTLSKGPLQVVAAVVERLMYRSLREAAGIIVTSGDLERHLAEHPELKGRSPVLTTIRNVFPPKTDYWAQDKTKGPSDRLNVLYAGTLGRAQKLTNALEAARLARESGITVNLRFVGAGATKKALRAHARNLSVRARFYSRVPADELSAHYDWADTALVHLTDWEPLRLAIPSKTYELMASGIHISGVVEGEAAEIIRGFDAGDVVSPEDPEALAQLWVDLARDRSRLKISTAGRDWVEQQRDEAAPVELFKMLELLQEKK